MFDDANTPEFLRPAMGLVEGTFFSQRRDVLSEPSVVSQRVAEMKRVGSSMLATATQNFADQIFNGNFLEASGIIESTIDRSIPPITDGNDIRKFVPLSAHEQWVDDITTDVPVAHTEPATLSELGSAESILMSARQAVDDQFALGA